MKVISIRQPWAWMILHSGKDVENRTWRTTYRGPLLIHAGLTVDMAAWNQLVESGTPIPDELDIGGIVGQVEVVDCVDHSDSPWFLGPFGLILTNPQPLPFRPLRGRLGLFDIP